MPKIHILCGLDHARMRSKLLSRYYELLDSGPPGAVLWLTPTYRSLDDVRRQLLSDRSSYLAPNLRTFQDFADEIVRANDAHARPVSHLQRRLLIDRVVSRLNNEGKLPLFQGVIETHGFSETIFALIGELKEQDISASRMLAAIEERRGASLEENSALSKHHQAALIYQGYQQVLDRRHWYDLEGRLGRARDLLSENRCRPFDNVQALFVHGFTSFTQSQLDILCGLASKIEETWVTLPYEEDPERTELFSPAQQTLQKLSSHLADRKHQLDIRIQSPASRSLPKDLAHVKRQLFRPLREVERSKSSEGISLIEAPGALGEARLIARRVKELLRAGTAPDDMLVVARDITPDADLLHEVFEEYQIPVDIEGGEPILKNGAVSFLLRILRIPEEDFPFAQVTALLRSNFFQPDWPETRSDAEIPSQSEALLRVLGEPRGRGAFVRAVQRWADNPPPLLEDELAEQSRRQRVHERAKKCRPFLVRFLNSWEDAPVRAPLRAHISWLKNIAELFGVPSAVEEFPRDREALERFWVELDRWQHLHDKLNPEQHLISRAGFYRLLHILAANTHLARTPRSTGRVRIVSAPQARGLTASHVFVIGLGERSFPQSAGDESLIDESQRQSLRQAGIQLPSLNETLPEEMLLFYQLVATPTKQLTLSYPAVDEKGQELLPSSFLATLSGCFESNAIPVTRRKMLIEGFDTDKPVSMAEYRIQAACALHANGEHWPLPARLSDHLRAVAETARQRFRSKDHGIYDGLLKDKALVDQIARMFSPKRILSPTSLESFVACPFKFYADHVLKLETLEDPNDEIESTDRGLAFHRALSRLHIELQSIDLHYPTDEVETYLMEQLDKAVNESNIGAGAAAGMLWQLEGQRLKKFGRRYPAHWKKFHSIWQDKKIAPRPAYFEAGFGLPEAEGEEMADALIIQCDDVEVRISGRIDRVDVAELPNEEGIGFWIIDYKTGSSAYYSSKSLKEFRRLQLTLYALAAQEVLFDDEPARPLGLAYWMVTENGANVVLPRDRKRVQWLEDPASWEKYAQTLKRWIVELASHIRSGQFALKPRSEDCTKTCEFSEICRISQSRQIVEEKNWHLPLPVV